jgi:hypothetical protein
MDGQQRRKHERKDSLNLIDYVVLGPEGNSITRRMGRTLNVSEGGILLETHLPLNRGQNVLITIALEEDIVEINGTVAYLTSCKEKRFCCGIEFKEVGKEGQQIVRKYMRALKEGEK